MPRRHCQSTRAAARGFSLIELAVTVVVLAVLAAIAVPKFGQLINRTRMTSSANEMVALMQTARSAAVTNRASVSVCPSTDGVSCAAAAGNRWIAVMTKAGVNSTLRDATFNSAIVVKPSANLSGASNKFTFTPNGFSAAGAQPSGTVRFCAPSVPTPNAVDVTANIGRISTGRSNGTSACTVPAEIN